MFLYRYAYVLFSLIFLLLAFPAVAFADDGPVSGEEVSSLAAWATISGALLPFVIGMVLQQTWSKSVQATLSAAICAIDALAVTYFDHGLHLDQHVVVTIALVFVTAQTTYKRFWQPALGVGVGPGLSPFGTSRTT